MKSHFLGALAALSLILASPAFAGMPVLGFEVGVTTLDQVRDRLGIKDPANDLPINAYSHGPMVDVDAANEGVEGLKSVLYIFDTDKRLCAVVMKLDNERFDFVYRSLAPKYKLVHSERPFVGNQYARFQAKDGIIEASAPHMSFEMEVRYLRADFFKAYLAKSAADRAAKARHDQAQF